MRVEITDRAYDQIFDYINQHNEYLMRPFYGTGLLVEQDIRSRYVIEGVELWAGMYDHVLWFVGRDIVPYELVVTDIRMTVTKFEKRLMFIKYHEFSDYREVFEIEIHYK
jgi:hypothetical protein